MLTMYYVQISICCERGLHHDRHANAGTGLDASHHTTVWARLGQLRTAKARPCMRLKEGVKQKKQILDA